MRPAMERLLAFAIIFSSIHISTVISEVQGLPPLPPGVEIVSAKDLGLSDEEVNRLLGQVGDMKAKDGLTPELLKVGFGPNQKLNLDSARLLPSIGQLTGADKYVAQAAIGSGQSKPFGAKLKSPGHVANSIQLTLPAPTLLPIPRIQSPRPSQQSLNDINQELQKQIMETLKQQSIQVSLPSPPKASLLLPVTRPATLLLPKAPTGFRPFQSSPATIVVEPQKFTPTSTTSPKIVTLKQVQNPVRTEISGSKFFPLVPVISTPKPLKLDAVSLLQPKPTVPHQVMVNTLQASSPPPTVGPPALVHQHQILLDVQQKGPIHFVQNQDRFQNVAQPVIFPVSNSPQSILVQGPPPTMFIHNHPSIGVANHNVVGEKSPAVPQNQVIQLQHHPIGFFAQPSAQTPQHVIVFPGPVASAVPSTELRQVANGPTEQPRIIIQSPQQPPIQIHPQQILFQGPPANQLHQIMVGPTPGHEQQQPTEQSFQHIVQIHSQPSQHEPQINSQGLEHVNVQNVQQAPQQLHHAHNGQPTQEVVQVHFGQPPQQIHEVQNAQPMQHIILHNAQPPQPVVHVHNAQPPQPVVHVHNAQPPQPVIHVQNAQPPQPMFHVQNGQLPQQILHVHNGQPPQQMFHFHDGQIPQQIHLAHVGPSPATHLDQAAFGVRPTGDYNLPVNAGPPPIEHHLPHNAGPPPEQVNQVFNSPPPQPSHETYTGPLQVEQTFNSAPHAQLPPQTLGEQFVQQPQHVYAPIPNIHVNQPPKEVIQFQQNQPIPEQIPFSNEPGRPHFAIPQHHQQSSEVFHQQSEVQVVQHPPQILVQHSPTHFPAQMIHHHTVLEEAGPPQKQFPPPTITKQETYSLPPQTFSYTPKPEAMSVTVRPNPLTIGLGPVEVIHKGIDVDMSSFKSPNDIRHPWKYNNRYPIPEPDIISTPYESDNDVHVTPFKHYPSSTPPSFFQSQHFRAHLKQKEEDYLTSTRNKLLLEPRKPETNFRFPLEASPSIIVGKNAVFPSSVTFEKTYQHELTGPQLPNLLEEFDQRGSSSTPEMIRISDPENAMPRDPRISAMLRNNFQDVPSTRINPLFDQIRSESQNSIVVKGTHYNKNLDPLFAQNQHLL